jgi:NADH:ubiquinone oxidoreductase subunit 4 (subunit M)
LGVFFGYGLISYGMILLSLWIGVILILATESVFSSSYFSVFLFLLLLFLLSSFIVLLGDLGYFPFMFFESRLIPILFLIFGWAY